MKLPKTWKKRISLFLTALLIAAQMFTTVSFAAETDESNKGKAGVGTVISIDSADDLPKEIKEGEYYALSADITMRAGQTIETLAGVLDGKGHTITLTDTPLA